MRKAHNTICPANSLGYRPLAPENRRPCALGSGTPHQADRNDPLQAFLDRLADLVPPPRKHPAHEPLIRRSRLFHSPAPMRPVRIDDKQQICYSAFMKATVTVTSRGVVTLPLGIRKALGIKADDTLIAETTPDGLLLRPAVTLPVEIYNDKRIREFDEAEKDLAVAMRRTPPTGTKSARRRG